MTDPLDQPEEETSELLYPFVVCQSQGGPYDDEAFVAGVQLGHIDRSLQVAAAAGADRIRFTIRTALARQVELAAMARGFPVVNVAEVEADPDGRWDAMPEWSHVTFETGGQ